MDRNRRILRLENLTFVQLENLDREKTVFLLGVSPIEEHGPHLPLGVDAFTATYFAETLAEKISKRWSDHTVVIMPTLFMGSSVVSHVGSINSRQSAVRNIVHDHLASLAEYGFRYFIVTNGHGGVRHVVALEEATRKISRKYNCQAISITGRLAYHFLRGDYADEIDRFMDAPLSNEVKDDLKFDSHAGQWETSMMLMLKPNLVDSVYKELPPVKLTFRDKLRRNYFFIEGRKGYTGIPHRADPRFAEASMKVLMAKAMEIVQRLLKDENVDAEVTSPLWRLLVFRTHFWQKFAAVLIITVLVIWGLTKLVGG